MPQIAASESAGAVNGGSGTAAEALEPLAEEPGAPPPADGEERREPLILIVMKGERGQGEGSLAFPACPDSGRGKGERKGGGSSSSPKPKGPASGTPSVTPSVTPSGTSSRSSSPSVTPSDENAQDRPSHS